MACSCTPVHDGSCYCHISPHQAEIGLCGFSDRSDLCLERISKRESRMKWTNSIRCVSVTLALLGIVVDGPAMAASKGAPQKIKIVPVGTIFDVSLTSNGSCAGRVVDPSGVPVKGAQVLIKQGHNEVSQVVTNQNGQYIVPNLRSGVYTVGTGSSRGTYRLWSEKTAPPSAKANCLLVVSKNGARGQCCNTSDPCGNSCDPCGNTYDSCGTSCDPCGVCNSDGSGWLLPAVGIISAAALVVGIVALAKDDNNNKVPASP